MISGLENWSDMHFAANSGRQYFLPASEATYKTVRGNMHIDTRVIEVADFKYEVKICH